MTNTIPLDSDAKAELKRLVIILCEEFATSHRGYDVEIKLAMCSQAKFCDVLRYGVNKLFEDFLDDYLSAEAVQVAFEKYAAKEDVPFV